MKKVLLYCLLIFGIHFQVFSQEKINNSAIGEISGFYYLRSNEPNVFLSLGFLLDSKKTNWQNGFRLDMQRLDLKKSIGGVKEYIAIQYMKRYNYNHNKFGIRQTFGAGLHNYVYTTPYFDNRTNGIVLSYGFDIGFNLEKIDLTLGFYLAGGYGYFKKYQNSVSTEGDINFKFTVIGSPTLKISFKR